jgi:hypothetical protein
LHRWHFVFGFTRIEMKYPITAAAIRMNRMVPPLRLAATSVGWVGFGEGVAVGCGVGRGVAAVATAIEYPVWNQVLSRDVADITPQ